MPDATIQVNIREAHQELQGHTERQRSSIFLPSLASTSSPTLVRRCLRDVIRKIDLESETVPITGRGRGNIFWQERLAFQSVSIRSVD